MDIDRYLTTTGRTARWLADAANTKPATICKLRDSASQPSRTAPAVLALRIEWATGGSVRADEVPLSEQGRKDLDFFRLYVAAERR